MSRPSGPAFEPSAPKVKSPKTRTDLLHAVIRESEKRNEEKKP